MYKHLQSLKRKKYQRAVNKEIRKFNKILNKDWDGRFVILQKKSQFKIYEDKSGASLYVYISFYDKQNKKEISFWFSSLEILYSNYKFVSKINNFIIDNVF